MIASNGAEAASISHNFLQANPMLVGNVFSAKTKLSPRHYQYHALGKVHQS